MSKRRQLWPSKAQTNQAAVTFAAYKETFIAVKSLFLNVWFDLLKHV